ncbi:hypothetical protein GOBAR_AA29018 [Gossypium barbadense]|uniref:Uncharacterized protein n=1 Tax=Gossypium barbadense TaxID=3634 RepID=A0A2P5WKP0_GOSBA|nr:hypothetical protein GOBAR_AA29018 [Gossypium barbadense]
MNKGREDVYDDDPKQVSTNYEPRVPYPKTMMKDKIEEQFANLPSNTEPNLREHLNAISAQDNEGFIAPEPELQQNHAMNKGREDVYDDDPKQMPNSAKFLKELLANKRKLDAISHVELNAVCSAILKNKLPNKLKDPGSFTIPCLIGSLSMNNALADLGASTGKLTLRAGDDAVTLQARDSVKTPKTQDNAIKPIDDKTNIQSSLQEPSQTKTIETVSYYHKKNKDVHEERRLRIEELDEWRKHKLRTCDKPKLHQNKLDTSPNQLKVGDKVLLDVIDPHIVTTTPNWEIPLTVLKIFPFGTVEVSHPKFGTFKHTRPGTRACLKPWPNRGRDTTVQDGRVEAGHDFPKTWGAINPHGRATWPWVNLIGRTRALAPLSSTYDPSHSEASAFPSSLGYLHAILAHTLTGRRESPGVINTHDAYYLRCMASAHMIDLAYFIAFTIHHQTERHKKRVISISPL